MGGPEIFSCSAPILQHFSKVIRSVLYLQSNYNLILKNNATYV